MSKEGQNFGIDFKVLRRNAKDFDAELTEELVRKGKGGKGSCGGGSGGGKGGGPGGNCHGSCNGCKGFKEE